MMYMFLCVGTGAPGGQRRMSDCLGLEFEVDASYPAWVLGPLQEQHWLSAFNHWFGLLRQPHEWTRLICYPSPDWITPSFISITAH